MNSSDLQKDAKEKLLLVWHGIQKVGFWILIILAVGAAGGIKYAKAITDKEIRKAILLGNFTWEIPNDKQVPVTKVFEVKERIVQ